MSATRLRPRRRSGYRAPDYLAETIELGFRLDPARTVVTARVRYRRRRRGRPLLALDGVGLELLAIRMDGALLPKSRYARTAQGLTLAGLPDAFELTVVTAITPADNPGLEGLYWRDGTFVTHCEPEGFRRITYFQDRPDVMTRFRVVVEADPGRYPTVLSNGALVERTDLPNGWRRTAWEDPYPKASYLFALVAGQFEQLSTAFVTKSGRPVAVNVHASPKDLPACQHGLRVLQDAMRWDETTYKREYDLDQLNLVVLPDYPGGAMENKGLNLYSREFFLAGPRDSDDEDSARVTAVVAHEYFHNWSGVRVGVRSWSELSLKEGLTVFRQQEFMGQIYGRQISRIDDLQRLAEEQYPEDDGALAHAVRPRGYSVASNLYTRTVYEKGAELIRTLRQVAGATAFDAGLEGFFACWDGQAATIDDLIDAVAAEAGDDLAQFRAWYDAAGAVRLTARASYDPSPDRLRLKLRQDGPSRAGVLHIPVRIGFLGENGQPLSAARLGEAARAEEHELDLRWKVEVFEFEGFGVRPIPALLRGRAAPVRFTAAVSCADLHTLVRYDPDDVVAWDALRQLLLRAVSGDDGSTEAEDTVVAAAADLLNGARSAGAVARCLQLPSTAELMTLTGGTDPEGLARARLRLSLRIAVAHADLLRRLHVGLAAVAAGPTALGERRLRNLCLTYLAALPDGWALAEAKERLRSDVSMNELVAALQIAVDAGGELRANGLRRFRDLAADHFRAAGYALRAQGRSDAPDCVEMAATALAELDLGEAARLKALMDSFCRNACALHRADGAGYRLVAGLARRLNGPNPRLGARFLKALDSVGRMNPVRQARAVEALHEILALVDLAPALREVAAPALRAAGGKVLS